MATRALAQFWADSAAVAKEARPASLNIQNAWRCSCTCAATRGIGPHPMALMRLSNSLSSLNSLVFCSFCTSLFFSCSTAEAAMDAAMLAKGKAQ